MLDHCNLILHNEMREAQGYLPVLQIFNEEFISRLGGYKLMAESVIFNDVSLVVSVLLHLMEFTYLQSQYN